MAPRGFTDSRLGGYGLAAVCLLGVTLPASADVLWPEFLAEVSIELEDEFIFRSTDAEAELNDALATVETDAVLAWPNGTGFYLTTVLEPVKDPEGDRYFNDFGLYLEQAYLAFPMRGTRIRAGKFNPVFGAASDLAPGLYGDELAGDYELAERLGVGVEVPFDAFGGSHLFHVATFVADRTMLSGSLFTARDRLRRRDGGVSNTARPGSFTVASTGNVGRTGYALGVRLQSRGAGDEADEYGGVIGLSRGAEIAGREVELFGEAAHFPNFDGANESTTFLTLGAEAEVGALSVSTAYGLRQGETGSADHVATVSAEWPLGKDLSLEAAYRFLDEEGERSHTLGLQLSYAFSFP